MWIWDKLLNLVRKSVLSIDKKILSAVLWMPSYIWKLPSVNSIPLQLSSFFIQITFFLINLLILFPSLALNCVEYISQSFLPDLHMSTEVKNQQRNVSHIPPVQKSSSFIIRSLWRRDYLLHEDNDYNIVVWVLFHLQTQLRVSSELGSLLNADVY